jgi:hypothetical protein
MARREHRELVICKGVSLEGRKFNYVVDKGGEFDYREGLVLKFDPISLQNQVKWRDGVGIRYENMLNVQKDHPNIVFELCPVDDPLWTEDARSMYPLPCARPHEAGYQSEARIELPAARPTSETGQGADLCGRRQRPRWHHCGCRGRVGRCGP